MMVIDMHWQVTDERHPLIGDWFKTSIDRWQVTHTNEMTNLCFGRKPVADGEDGVEECDENDDDSSLEPVGPLQCPQVGVPDADKLLLATRVGYKLEWETRVD